MVNSILKTHKIKAKKEVKENYNTIIEKIAEEYNIAVIDILGDSRKKELSLPRQIAMYIIRKKFNKPFEDIGTIFSKRNHATVMHAVKKIEELMNDDKDIKNKVKKFL